MSFAVAIVLFHLHGDTYSFIRVRDRSALHNRVCANVNSMARTRSTIRIVWKLSVCSYYYSTHFGCSMRNLIRIRMIVHSRNRTIDSITHLIWNRFRNRDRMCDHIVNSVRIVSMRIRVRGRGRGRVRVRVRIRIRIRTSQTRICVFV